MASGDLIVPTAAGAPGPATVGQERARLAAAAVDYAEASQAAATRRAYNTSWRAFEAWCARLEEVALPASAAAVAVYLTHRAEAGARVATMARDLAAIRDRHKASNLPQPRSAHLGVIWSGIRRRRAAPQRQVRALTTDVLRKVIAKLPTGAAGVRDKALLLVAFAGALRRSELAALELESGSRVFSTGSIGFVPGGLRISLLRSKTDQEGAGAIIAIPKGKTALCPHEALRAWTTMAGISAGPVFRPVDRHGRIGPAAMTDRAIADVIKRACARAGFDPALFSGHSPRAGMVTEAFRRGVAIDRVMKQTRHKRVDTVMRYAREVDAMKTSAAKDLGL